MRDLNSDKDNLKKFGIAMGVVFSVITVLILSRHKHNILPTAIISIFFFVSALIIPVLLKPVYILWMKLALAVAWINTRLILSIIFYLVFTPMGLVMRIFGIDLLDKKIDKHKHSYWIKKEKKVFNSLDYERQF